MYYNKYTRCISPFNKTAYLVLRAIMFAIHKSGCPCCYALILMWRYHNISLTFWNSVRNKPYGLMMIIPGWSAISQHSVSLEQQINDGMFHCFIYFTISKQTRCKAIYGLTHIVWQPCTTITVKATTQTTLLMKSETYLICVCRVETKTRSFAVLNKTFSIISTQYSIISWHAKVI